MIMVSYLYSVTNKINGKQYIGKANDPVHRWKEHLDCARLQIGNSAIAAAIRKYGHENFIFEVIGEFESEELAYLHETYEIIERRTLISQNGYNITRGGRGGKEGFLMPEEVRQKISKMRKGMKFSDSHRENLSKAFTGRTHTKEVRDKMSINRRGSLNHQAKLNEDKVREIKKHFKHHDKTLKQLAKEFNVSHSTIKAIKSGRLWPHVECQTDIMLDDVKFIENTGEK